jgi:hypothetical protein
VDFWSKIRCTIVLKGVELMSKKTNKKKQKLSKDAGKSRYMRMQKIEKRKVKESWNGESE